MITVITAPAVEPVGVADVKFQLGIGMTDTAQDSLIERRITQARQYCENYLQRALNTQTLELRLDQFCDKIELPMPPVLSVVHVKYVATDGTVTTLDSANYVLDTYAYKPFVREAYGVSWPSVRDEPSAVRVQYTAGYGAAATDVPVLIREAVLLIVGHWMNFQPQAENGVTLSRIPFAVRDILDQYRIP